ncbi:cytochrome P450 [Maricaulis sp. D1M11]|uniref:cytochrome P450 n=1 Tax=Maricaulis sp. D1M11 TaxID=3076117 RepID=UPI0039B5C13C
MTAFTPPMPPMAQYSEIGRMTLSDYRVYFRAMRNNPLEIWGERHFHLRVAPFQFLGRSSVITNDPDCIRHVHVSHADNFELNPLRQAVLRPILRDGLLTAEGEIWKTVRHAVAPVFTPRKVNAFAPQIHTIAEAAADSYANRIGEVVPASQDMVDLTLNILMDTLFSGDDALDTARFTDNIHQLLLISGIPHLFDLLGMPAFVPRIGQGKSRRVVADIRRQVGELATSRRARPGPEAEGRLPDFLDLLLGAGLEDDAVIDNLLTFLAAGHETTARSLTWTLYLLSQAEDVRERLESEIDTAPLDATAPQDWSEILPFTEAVLKESMRLYPPAPILARTSIEGQMMAGIPLPPRSDVLVSTWLLHRQREMWREPDAFIPDRFLGEEAQSIGRFAYLPFGIGPRVCIGARFAMMEMVIVLACLLRRVRFDFAGDRHPVPVQRVTLQPDIEVPLTLTRR